MGAKPTDHILVLASYRLENQGIIEVNCAYFDAYVTLPEAVEFRGEVYGKTGWNSDNCKACYKTGVPLARPIGQRGKQ
jgi:hypothetical protein